MTTLSWIAQGFLVSLSPINVAAMAGGALLGVMVGSLPGLTAAAAMTVLLPLTFGMPAATGVLLLLAIWNAAVWAGAIPGILLNIPGTAAAAATTIDGHPLAQQGHAARAIRASIVGSTFGAFAAGLALLLLAGPLSDLATKAGPAEMFTFALFGLSLIVSISSSHGMLQGMISLLIGLFVATVGYSPAGVARFVFMPSLLGGFPVIPTLIGVFTIPQVLSLIGQRRDRFLMDTGSLAAHDDFLLRASDWGKHWFNLVRSALVGIFVGIHPGAGPTVCSFICYNEARRAYRPGDVPFGQGNVGGVIAADTGANAAVLASLVPALAVGIPGSADTVIVMAALTLHGLTPGPGLVQKAPLTIYTILTGVFVANFFMLVIGWFGARYVAQLTRIRVSILVPLIVVAAGIGAFATENNWFNALLAFGFGVFCYGLHKIGISLVPLVLGLILGPILEVNLNQSLQVYGTFWNALAVRPVALVFLFIAILAMVWPMIVDARKALRLKRSV